MTDPETQTQEFLTVRELAELLRLKERKVYDLAASGDLPCSRATGKLLFPAAEVRAWIDRAKSGGHAAAATRPPIMLGSHDPLLDWAIRESGCGLATYFDGSLDGLARFVGAEGVATGLHVYDARTARWNVPAVSRVAGAQNAVLVSFARRRRGLVFRPDGPRPETLADIAGFRVAPRQEQSGTAGLFEALAAERGLDTATLTFTQAARTEDDAVDSVRRGAADVTFGLEAVARRFGVDFAPVIDEEFALLVDRKAWFDPPLQTLVAFLGTERFREQVCSYGGYDASQAGAVVWNA
ncbi:helix-turn-helix transcriptional regulator [Roseovarius salinarum]|uniref:helix-turn-helix transcriptional regulator n=1 Tax=Roseovarius salinarum TaxID=1981892 RepID=UPI000C345F5E|nr:helix-turn-helix transcriptional regulator [Roseovarius salinarum]